MPSSACQNDVPANALLAVQITTLPSAGTLTDNGLALTAGQFVPAADTAAGMFVYSPGDCLNLPSLPTRRSSDLDDAGTANGGANLYSTPRTMTVNVTWVNDAPQGTN